MDQTEKVRESTVNEKKKNQTNFMRRTRSRVSTRKKYRSVSVADIIDTFPTMNYLYIYINKEYYN